MPLNPMSFQPQQSTDWSSLSNLFGNVQKGYEAAAQPHKMAQEYLHRIMENKLLGLKAKQAQQEIGLHDFIWNNGDNPGGGNGVGGNPPSGANLMQQSEQNGTDMSQVLPKPQNQGSRTVGGFSPERLREGAIAQKFGLGHASVTPLPGGQSAVYNPKTGGFDVQQLGSTPGETEFEKGVASANVKAVEQNYEAYTAAANQKHSIQGMLKLLENPDLEKVVGPFWKNSAAKYFGSDKAKELQATFNTFGKNVITETAKAFAGKFTNQEMNWLQDVLPNDKDTYPAIQGKLQTLEMLRQANEQKAIIKDSLIRQQMPPIIADQMAESQIDLSAIKRSLKPTVAFRSPNGDIEDVPKSDSAYAELLRNAGYQEVDY